MDTDVPCEFTFNKSEVQNLLSERTQPDDCFEKYEPIWYGVFGWLDPNQGKWLFEAAKKQIYGHVVEIGSAYGRSTICLALGAKLANTGRVYAVDPHTGDIEIKLAPTGEMIPYSSLKGLDRNISRFDLQYWVIQIPKKSNDYFVDWQTSPNPIRLLFVDGWHTYDAVFQDICNWSQYVTPDGTIAVHDYKKEEIKNAVHDSMKLTGFSKMTLIDENMVALTKG